MSPETLLAIITGIAAGLMGAIGGVICGGGFVGLLMLVIAATVAAWKRSTKDQSPVHLTINNGCEIYPTGGSECGGDYGGGGRDDDDDDFDAGPSDVYPPGLRKKMSECGNQHLNN